MTTHIANERLMKIILQPHVSEKTAMAAEVDGQYVFKVLVDSDKLEIKRAIEHLFDVKVASVRTVNQKGIAKRVGRTMGRTKAWKKAYVRLQEGHAIDFGGKA